MSTLARPRTLLLAVTALTTTTAVFSCGHDDGSSQFHGVVAEDAAFNDEAPAMGFYYDASFPDADGAADVAPPDADASEERD